MQRRMIECNEKIAVRRRLAPTCGGPRSPPTSFWDLAGSKCSKKCMQVLYFPGPGSLKLIFQLGALQNRLGHAFVASGVFVASNLQVEMVTTNHWTIDEIQTFRIFSLFERVLLSALPGPHIFDTRPLNEKH